MDLIRRALVALHPRDWRQRYGDEFAALLGDTRLTPRAVADTLAHGAGLRVRAHATALLAAVAALVSVSCEIIAWRTGLSANILWPPTSPLRALVLAGAVTPWVAFVLFIRIRHRSADRG